MDERPRANRPGAVMNEWLRQTMLAAAMAGAVAVFAAGTTARAQLRTPTTSSHETTTTVITSNEDDATTRDADKAEKDNAAKDKADEAEQHAASASRAAQR